MNAVDALRRAKLAATGARVVRLLHATPLKRTYLVERSGERLVMRVDEPLAADVALDRAAEWRILQAASAAGVAPEPVLADTRAPALLVTRLAPGRAWTRGNLADPRHLERLARLLRRVHALPAPGPLLDLPAAMRRYAGLAGDGGARRLAEEGTVLLAAAGYGHRAAALCHHDPIAANVVGWRRTVLVDWEYAAGGDPLFDLAVVIGHHRLGRRASRRLVAAYFDSGTGLPWGELDAARGAYDRLLRLWSRALEPLGALSAGQRRHWLGAERHRHR